MIWRCSSQGDHLSVRVPRIARDEPLTILIKVKAHLRPGRHHVSRCHYVDRTGVVSLAETTAPSAN
jgi:hypothetical protein